MLLGRGHRVIEWAPERFRGQIEASGAEFRCHDPFPLRGSMRAPQMLTASLAQYTAEGAEPLIQELLAEDVELIVHDYQALWARVAGEFLGVPRIISHPLFPGNARNLPPFHPLQPELLAPGLASQIGHAVDRTATARVAINRRWGVDIGGWLDAMVSSAEHTVLYTTAQVSGITQSDPGWVFAGPLMREFSEMAQAARSRSRESGEASWESWARPRESGARPRVFASLGTVFNFDPAAYGPLIAGLANQPLEVLLSLGGGPVCAEDLAPLPANLRIRTYVEDVATELASSQVFLTHAGASSLHEALLAGVPMVCVPQGADQFAWAARVEQLGAGVVAEPTADSIRHAVHDVLTDARFRQRADALGKDLRTFPGEDLVGELAERVLSPVGPAHRAL